MNDTEAETVSESDKRGRATPARVDALMSMLVDCCYDILS